MRQIRYKKGVFLNQKCGKQRLPVPILVIDSFTILLQLDRKKGTVILYITIHQTLITIFI